MGGGGWGSWGEGGADESDFFYCESKFKINFFGGGGGGRSGGGGEARVSEFFTKNPNLRMLFLFFLGGGGGGGRGWGARVSECFLLRIQI